MYITIATTKQTIKRDTMCLKIGIAKFFKITQKEGKLVWFQCEPKFQVKIISYDLVQELLAQD